MATEWEQLLTAVSIPGPNPLLSIAGKSRPSSTWSFWGRVLPDHLIYAVSRGSFRARWSGIDTTVASGDAVYLPPGVGHDFSEPRDGFTVVHLRFTTLTTPVGSSAAILRGAATLGPLAHSVLTAADHGRFAPWRQRAALVRLIAAMADLATRPPGALSADEVRCLQATVAADPTVTPRDLARRLQRSPLALARRLRATTGLAPRTWLVHERVRLAATALVESRSPLATIASAHGFGDVYRFSKQFRQVLGCSPSLWRRDHGAPMRLR